MVQTQHCNTAQHEEKSCSTVFAVAYVSGLQAGPCFSSPLTQEASFFPEPSNGLISSQQTSTTCVAAVNVIAAQGKHLKWP